MDLSNDRSNHSHPLNRRFALARKGHTTGHPLKRHCTRSVPASEGNPFASPAQKSRVSPAGFYAGHRREIRLTQSGRRQSSSFLRSHRLWEVFLLRHLGYSRSEVHEDAELLEHVTSPRLAQKLDDFLNHPDFCPHGSAIPQADGRIPVMPLRKLSEMSVGETSVIRRVAEEKELLDYLKDLGVSIGGSCTVLSIGPYEGPFAIKLDGPYR